MTVPTHPLLAIETSGSTCSVAIAVDGVGQPPAHEFTATSHGHAAMLVPMIARLAKATGITFTALGGIAVSCGPGGFTGIRVGLATARAMALAAACPLIGIGTFQALAATAMRSGGKLRARNLVVLDSRRKELFAQELGPDLMPLRPAELLPAEAIAARCAEDVMLIADAELTMLAPLDGLHATADAIAVTELAQRRPDLHLPAEPIYLRPPDISEPKTRKPQAGAT